MAQISIQNLTFAYDGSYDNVFTDVTVTLDTCWRLGLTGRNGRGKTTLLRLLMGEVIGQGNLSMPLQPVYFPFSVSASDQLTLFLMQEMGQDAPEWKMKRELNLLKVEEDVLYRPFDTLSNGEQTKVQLAALFAREDAYPMIDEPTNHLDLQGRKAVADYLRTKEGFLLVSHDREFLNRCIDHVLSLNKEGIQVVKGDYDAFARDMERQNQHEIEENQRLKKDIRRLEESARRTAQWSQNVEKGKHRIPGDKAADKGYIGARSAEMMKRALSARRRQDNAVEEKAKLLKNVERVGNLKLSPLVHCKKVLVDVREGAVQYGEKRLCHGFTFSVSQGERVALAGANGTGKSSILKSLCGLSHALTGNIMLASGLMVSYVPQSVQGLAGEWKDFIAEHRLDESLFKAVLRNMDVGRQQFEKKLEDLSQGQKKKILLARSLCEPAHLYLWDEPLNYVDILSRGQVEQLILEFHPTLLLVEHDGAFLDKICTKVVNVG